MKTVTETLTAPACWASYLVNGDASGIDVIEKAHADAWKEREGIVSVTDTWRDEAGDGMDPYFTWQFQLYDPLAVGIDGGSVLDYVCEVATLDGTEGQDRESYSDTQDRDNYTVEE